MTDPHGLDRFIDAQAPTYVAALREMTAGRKESHWMWFIFPQLAGLGRSPTAQYYALHSREEARAYLAHPTLGTRLRESVAVLQALPSPRAEDVFGDLDAMKLRSSLTLVLEAGGGAAFASLLDRWFGGQRDPATLRLLDQR